MKLHECKTPESGPLANAIGWSIMFVVVLLAFAASVFGQTREDADAQAALALAQAGAAKEEPKKVEPKPEPLPPAKEPAKKAETYSQVSERAFKAGVPLVVLVDCDLKGHSSEAMEIFRCGSGKWFDLTTEQGRGVVVAVPQGDWFVRGKDMLPVSATWADVKKEIQSLGYVRKKAAAPPKKVTWLANPSEAEVLIFKMQNCSWCEKYEATLSDPAVVNVLAELKVAKVSREKHQDLVRRYAVQGYPTTVVIDGNFVSKREGYMTPQALVAHLRFMKRGSASLGEEGDYLLWTVDEAVDEVPANWPLTVPYPKGLMPYLRARMTQSIFKLNDTPTIRPVPRSQVGPNRADPRIKWQVSGGMDGIREGWKSEVFKLLPHEPQVKRELIPVKNSFGVFQHEFGLTRSYPDGTMFVDHLTNSDTGLPFETRVAEKVNGEWRRYVAFRDESQRPAGYNGLKGLTCATCHTSAAKGGPGSGDYGVGLVPGSDTVVSDPVPQLEGR